MNGASKRNRTAWALSAGRGLLRGEQLKVAQHAMLLRPGHDAKEPESAKFTVQLFHTHPLRVQRLKGLCRRSAVAAGPIHAPHFGLSTDADGICMLSYSAIDSGVGRCSADQGPLHTYSLVSEAGTCRGDAGAASPSLSDAACCIAKVSTSSASLSDCYEARCVDSVIR